MFLLRRLIASSQAGAHKLESRATNRFMTGGIPLVVSVKSIEVGLDEDIGFEFLDHVMNIEHQQRFGCL